MASRKARKQSSEIVCIGWTTEGPLGERTIMRAELRSLLTVEGEPLESVRPLDGIFHVALRAMIGPVGSEGEESFDFTICSPAWLAIELERHPVIGGRSLLIANEFNARHVEAHVRKLIEHASGKDWSAVAEILSRWSKWEFEDYQP